MQQQSDDKKAHNTLLKAASRLRGDQAMEEERRRESEFERRVRELSAYRDAMREARRIKAGLAVEHPWLRSAAESKERASRPSRAEDRRARDRAPESGGKPSHRAFLRVALSLFAVAAVLLFLSLEFRPGERPAGTAGGDTPVVLWHGLADEEELARLKSSAERLAAGGVAVRLAGEDGVPFSLYGVLPRSALPDIAIVDFATAEALRASGLLTAASDGRAVGYFPLAPLLPWSRPLVLVALTKDRSQEESDRLLLVAQELHRLLVDDPKRTLPSPP